MTHEEKQLLLKDLCARLPYGVKVSHFLDLLRIEKDVVTKELLGVIPSSENVMVGYDINNYEDSVIEDIKPYLRPMSNLIEKELNECRATCKYRQVGQSVLDCATPETIDYLLSHHFDYRGLIEKGLALKAPKGMYKTK